MAVANLDSHPLPEHRPRVWLVGSKDAAWSADQWHEEIMSLHASCRELPQHTLHSLVSEYGTTKLSENHQGGTEIAKAWEHDAKYAAAFAAALKKAASRLPHDYQPKPIMQRPSKFYEWANTPWLQAQVDVYAALFDAFPVSNEALCMADISQSLNRGSTPSDGSWGTVTTSTKLACIAGKHGQLDLSGRLLQPKAHLGMMGYSVPKLKLSGLSGRDCQQLAGNAMSFTQAALCLAPLLKHIGCLL